MFRSPAIQKVVDFLRVGGQIDQLPAPAVVIYPELVSLVSDNPRGVSGRRYQAIFWREARLGLTYRHDPLARSVTLETKQMPGKRLAVEHGVTRLPLRQLGKGRQQVGEIDQGVTGNACRHQTWATYNKGNIDAPFLQCSLAAARWSPG
jgi:hypothetical protein